MAASSKVNGKATAKDSSSKKAATAAATTTPEQANDHSSSGGRPDRTAYDEEQNKLRAEIDALQAKFNAVKDKINLTSKDGPQAERRKVLRDEFDQLRNTQANGKNSRGKVIEQLKALNEDIAKKSKELQASKSKYPYRSLADLDAHVKKLEAQIDSGNLKLAEEKRALQEVSNAKRSRKVLESFQKDQQAIDADRAKAAELSKSLDDPEMKALDDKFKAIKEELDSIKEEGDKAFASRNALFNERNALKEQLDELFTKKKASAQAFREANDKYHLKIAEDRARRNEKRRLQKQSEEAEKAQLIAERLREEAEYPAYQREIEECQLLIEHFSVMQKGGIAVEVQTEKVIGTPRLANVPSLEVRQVDTTPAAGYTALKKKGEEEGSYFVATGGKGKKNKGNRSSTPQSSPNPAAGANNSSPSTPSSGPLKLPFHIIEALMKMSIPTPSPDEIPRVVEDIKTKKSWFEANQARMTKENQEKAEREIQRLMKKTGALDLNNNNEGEGEDLVPPNGDGEKPAEPVSTPAGVDSVEAKSNGVSTDALDEKLETVQE